MVPVRRILDLLRNHPVQAENQVRFDPVQAEVPHPQKAAVFRDLDHPPQAGAHPAVFVHLLVEAVEAAAHHQEAVQDLQAVQAEAVVVLKESSMLGRIRLCEY